MKSRLCAKMAILIWWDLFKNKAQSKQLKIGQDLTKGLDNIEINMTRI